MKKLKYKFLVTSKTIIDPEKGEVTKEFFSNCILPYSEANEELAKKEAYNGEYEIFEDEKTESVPKPTQLDRIEAQVTYTAMITDTLLEG